MKDDTKLASPKRRSLMQAIALAPAPRHGSVKAHHAWAQAAQKKPSRSASPWTRAGSTAPRGMEERSAR
jgi:hypothetical protein